MITGSSLIRHCTADTVAPEDGLGDEGVGSGPPPPEEDRWRRSDWINFHLAHDALPARRVVVQFDFPEQPPAHRRFWVLFQRSGAEICYAPPGLPIDLAVKAGSEALTRWHVGAIEWRDAVRSGAIQVTGPPALARALPTWNRRAVVAAPRS